MAVGDECWVPRDPNWTPFGRAFDEATLYGYKKVVAPEAIVNPDYHGEPWVAPYTGYRNVEVSKIAVVLPISEEYLAMEQFDYMDVIKRAPARRCQREAMETYWDVMPEWDNPCIERGSE